MRDPRENVPKLELLGALATWERRLARDPSTRNVWDELRHAACWEKRAIEEHGEGKYAAAQRSAKKAEEIVVAAAEARGWKASA